MTSWHRSLSGGASFRCTCALVVEANFPSPEHCVYKEHISISFLQGWTPLHSAVSAGHDLVVERLIGVEADVNAATSGGQTPLHYAVR
jgi:Ankyrin repeats (3 copies)